MSLTTATRATWGRSSTTNTRAITPARRALRFATVTRNGGSTSRPRPITPITASGQFALSARRHGTRTGVTATTLHPVSSLKTEKAPTRPITLATAVN